MLLSFYWCINLCSSLIYSQLFRDKAEDRVRGRTSLRLFRFIIACRKSSIIRTSESMALQHQHDSKPCNTRGWIQGNTIWRGKNMLQWKGKKEGGERKTAPCCSAAVWFSGLTTLHFPPLHLFHPCDHSLTSPCGTYLFAVRSSGHTHALSVRPLLFLLSELVKRRPLIQKLNG